MDKLNLELDSYKIPTLVYAGEIENLCGALDTPQKVAETMMPEIGHMAEEYVYMLALDVRKRVLGVFEISHGTVDMSIITPREIFIRALVCGASSIVLVHNHPSGNKLPSKHDLEVTEAVVSSGKLLNVPLLDHIILTSEDFFSFKDEKYII